MNVFKRLSFSFLCALLLFGCAADWRIFAKETRTSLCPSPVSLEDFSVYEQPDAAAKAYLVMEATTGRVLCGQNIHQRLPMASTTKIIGAMMVLEQPNLHDYFLVDPDAIQVEGSSMGLMEGDMVSLYALACGMLLPSGNDAAGATAVKLAGSYAAFAEQMNRKAQELGMTQSHFVTPSGLHDAEHYSTARDMALLTAAALQNETFREICGQASAKVCFGNPPYERWLTNSNKLLTMDETVIGVKTGFTDEAGRCLVSASVRNGITLICVTLNDRNDWQDHEVLYDYGFGQLSLQEVTFPADWTLPVTGGTTGTAAVAPAETLTVGVKDGNMPAWSYQLNTPPFLYAPLTAGQEAGTWKLLLDGRVAAQGRLLVQSAVTYQEKTTEPEPRSWWKRLLQK